MKNLIPITIAGLLCLWLLRLLEDNLECQNSSNVTSDRDLTFSRKVGIYDASINFLDASGNFTSISVDSIERAYKKIGPFSLKAAPYLEAKNVVIETKEAISEPQKLFSSHVAKIVGQDVKAPVIITELLVVVGSKTNRYENVRL
jgi:hypothetical protein